MFGKPDQSQQWSVHAEFTISHPGASDPENLPQTHTEQNDNGVRMTYRWTSPESWATQSTPQSASASNRSVNSDVGKCYGFQKGNLYFTSTPPKRGGNYQTDPGSNNISRTQGIQDSSGYGSDLLSPNSLASGSLPRPILPYNRKCRSTCNIVLCSNVSNQRDAIANRTSCGRTQSLRCQSPASTCDHKEVFYGCGDPWCHHLHYADDFSCSGKISPVLEVCEEYSSNTSPKRPSRASTFNTPVQLNVPSPQDQIFKKDACVQTAEMIDKCTSPFMKTDSFKFNKKSPSRKRNSQKSSPHSLTPDSLDKYSHRDFPQYSKLRQRVSTDKDSNDSNSDKKPRTVHIDVYCTGTEIESDSSSENETASTPQTVFESNKVHITHKKAKGNDLPFYLKDKTTELKNAVPKSSTLQSKTSYEDDDDDDDMSTSYPSKMSSFSTIRDFSSSISSVPKSWTSFSKSSMTIPEDEVNTSWKDTFSDIDSLLQSRSSITQVDSLDFVPQKLYKNSSIDETPEYEQKHLIPTSSNVSLQQSDSFEYANLEDRLRIKKMEEMWKNKSHSKPWKSPQAERKYLFQQKKMKEFIENKLNNIKDSDSDVSDDSEKGWTFIKGDDKKLVRDGTVRRASKDNTSDLKAPESNTEKTPSDVPNTSTDNSDSKVLQQRLSLDPTYRSPFSLLPGLFTEQRYIANKFGTVVSALRKPGHHIGPAKNPDCLCDHCQRYFENAGHRNRTRSMGDSPTFQVQNWRSFLHPDAISNNKSDIKQDSASCRDF